MPQDATLLRTWLGFSTSHPSGQTLIRGDIMRYDGAAAPLCIHRGVATQRTQAARGGMYDCACTHTALGTVSPMPTTAWVLQLAETQAAASHRSRMFRSIFSSRRAHLMSDLQFAAEAMSSALTLATIYIGGGSLPRLHRNTARRAYLTPETMPGAPFIASHAARLPSILNAHWVVVPVW